jgi:endoglucanase Acf2
MTKRLSAALTCLALISLLTGCSGGNEGPQPGASQQAATLAPPTPAFAGVVEVGGAIPLVPLRPANKTAGSSSAVRLLATTSVADNPLGPVSTTDPRQILGTDRALANPFQPGNISDLKLVRLPDDPNDVRTRMPTGTWSKGFFYQSPRNIDAYFQNNGDNPDPDTGIGGDPRNVGADTSQFNIFAFPNKLSLDDRIGMLSVSFPTRRFIAYGIEKNADVYDLSNPLKADTLLYHIAPNSSQDMRLSYVQPDVGRLPRQIDRFDALTVATSWKSAAAKQSMQVIAAVGSPFVTVVYDGLRPVIQVGQGSKARTAKDKDGLPISGIAPDYTQQESDNSIVAVAVGEEHLTTFIENNNIRINPKLTGTKFRMIYQVPDRARATPGTNNDVPVTELNSYKELVIYTSSPITLEWDTPSRSYVSRAAFSGVIRTAFVDAVDREEWVKRINDISDIPSFKARRAILDRYAATYPTASEIFLDYDKQATGLVKYVWSMARMDSQTPQGSDLLMMGFDATHIPSLQNATKVDGLTYRSNFGMMSAVAGNEWSQKLTIPDIMRNGASGKQLWMGSGEVKEADKERIRKSLADDTKLLTRDFLATCNADSYICGKYLHNVARLALIADNLKEYAIRDQLTAYLKNSLRLWLDGVDPMGNKFDAATDTTNDTLAYDTTNGGIITSLGLQDHKKDYSNRAYVDHMFHYGYYIYAASVIATLDTERDPNLKWLPLNKDKVNLLVRDIANPSLDDKYFPIVRTFDWFRMQNIADTGPDANGGNTESSSESINSNYALATWGAVTENSSFQALAAIMTAAEIRTSKAYYQVTPDTAYLKDIDFPEVSVTVKLPNNGSEMRTISPGKEPVMNILRSNIAETNTFFGPLLANRIGINLLPISPISEFVISPDWATVHADTLRKLENTNTTQFDAIVNTPPNQGAACFLAGWDLKNPPKKKDGTPEDPNPGAICAGRLRVLYSWRQLPVAASGMTKPAEAYQRYIGYMDALKVQQDTYQLNTRSSVYPDSSRNENGVVADVLKDNSTPSTDTNTLWWLSARKPN